MRLVAIEQTVAAVDGGGRLAGELLVDDGADAVLEVRALDVRLEGTLASPADPDAELGVRFLEVADGGRVALGGGTASGRNIMKLAGMPIRATVHL